MKNVEKFKITTDDLYKDAKIYFENFIKGLEEGKAPAKIVKRFKYHFNNLISFYEE